MDTEKIQLRAQFSVPPSQIYKDWLDSEGHEKMTGGGAEASSIVGAPHTAWDGYISGKNLELEENKRILQSWRTTEFPADAPDSTLEVLLEPMSNGGTELTLNHSGLQPGDGEKYHSGWIQHYFNPMSEFYG